MYSQRFFFVLAIFILSSIFIFAEETAGQRPYEMVNAGRNVNPNPPLVNFENITGWTVDTVESEAKWERSAEQRIWGEGVGKLTYKNVQSEQRKTPVITLKAPQPIAIPMLFDCIDLWLYGNNWAWESDNSTPRVQIDALLQNANNNIVKVHLETVRWKEWFLIHRKLSPEQIKLLGDKPVFVGFEIRGGGNKDFRTLYFGDLSFYKEELKPLTYEPRPQRGIVLPEGQTTGTNTGAGKLPFPNREDTLLPTNVCKEFKNTVDKKDDTVLLEYNGADGKLVWTYHPKDIKELHGTWTATGKAAQTFVLHLENTVRQADGLNNLINISLKQKSLIIDVAISGGNVQDITFGSITGTKNPRLVKVPYLVGQGTNRPAVLVDGDKDNPLFVLPLVDHTRSNASELFFDYKIDDSNAENKIVHFDGGARYLPKTDGKRNDIFERLFITVSDKFEEVLPNIPNNSSPFKEITAERVWRAHGSSNHDNDYKYWQRLKRYGVDKMLMTDHETMWRDGGESFTFRTYAAPGRGGDKGHQEYTEKIHGLGYIYGPYNNYTDYAPVNAFWNPDWVARLRDGNYQPAWARCYNPKPSRAVEVEPKITEEIQKKFHFNTAYCDVHTAVTPWQYVDYDARVPGAGTFAATYYAYGELLLHQKKIWNGPVYSEGNNHWYYSGLTDGNYAQDQAYRIPKNPWLVDFDLLKMHPLENNFGMGNPGMFYGRENFRTEKEKTEALDRFIAATLAFGHTGFLAMDFGFANGIRSYFMVQAVAKRYGTQKVKSIHYADEDGNYLTTSEAVAADKVKLNRLRIEYEDGLTLYINGNNETLWNGNKMSSVPLEEWNKTFVLLPNGWFVNDPKDELSAHSRGMYVIDSPKYMFAENTEYFNQLNGKIFCDKQLIVLKNVDDKGSADMIVGEPHYDMRSSIHGVQLDDKADADAFAFDFDGKELGKAETRYTNGIAGAMVFVMPVKDAFRYRLTPKVKPDKVIFDELGAVFFEKSKLTMPALNQDKVSPGQTLALKIGNKDSHKDFTITIPPDAKPHSLHWVEKNGIWAAFRVFPLCDVTAIIKQDKPNEIKFEVGGFPLFEMCFMRNKDKFSVECVQNGNKQIQENDTRATFTLEPATAPRVLPLTLKITAEQEHPKNKLVLEKNYTLKTDWGFHKLPPLPEHWTVGYCQRGKTETAVDGKSGAYAYQQQCDCGDKSKQGWGIHPPYQGGVGYTYLLSEPFVVTNEDGVAFSSEVGIRNGGDASDGVLYKVYANDELIAEKNWSERSWTPLTADLSKWQGKTIRLKLVADVGTKDNSNADWAAWTEIKLVPTKKVLITTVE